ncbi:MAG: hypothetical protein K8963_02835 [Proteobacteria bacterium]|nr:hypothetical protein [Pseudomonadota bacterium]
MSVSAPLSGHNSLPSSADIVDGLIACSFRFMCIRSAAPTQLAVKHNIVDGLLALTF